MRRSKRRNLAKSRRRKERRREERAARDAIRADALIALRGKEAIAQAEDEQLADALTGFLRLLDPSATVTIER